MIRGPPSSTLTAPPLPYTSLFRSVGCRPVAGAARLAPPRRSHLRRDDRRHALHRHGRLRGAVLDRVGLRLRRRVAGDRRCAVEPRLLRPAARRHAAGARSEEHTSELQSLMRISYAVFCLKKKTKIKYII